MERERRKLLAQILIPFILLGSCYFVGLNFTIIWGLGYLFGYFLCLLVEPKMFVLKGD